MFVGVFVVDVAEQVVLLGQAQQRLDAGFADRALQHVRQQRAGVDLDLGPCWITRPSPVTSSHGRAANVVLDGDEAAHRS